MANKTIKAIISGIGHYVPDYRLTNQDLEKMIDTNDEWITTRTGIKERRILKGEKGTSYMAIRAAQEILNQKNISADEIDLIIMATVTPDMMVPITAAYVQKELDAKNCWGFDLNMGCCSFVCAFITAVQFIENGTYKKVLVIGADKMSSIIDYQDRNTCIIFGDAGAAVLVEPDYSMEVGVVDYMQHLDGEGAQFLTVPGGGSLYPSSYSTIDQNMHYVHQKGNVVFKYAVKRMGDVTAEILSKNNLTGEDLTLFIPHQANRRIIDSAAKRIGLNDDKVFINIDRYGNTTSASIPLGMYEAYKQNRIKRKDWILMSAFGAGFSWGSVLLRWAF